MRARGEPKRRGRDDLGQVFFFFPPKGTNRSGGVRDWRERRNGDLGSRVPGPTPGEMKKRGGRLASASERIRFVQSGKHRPPPPSLYCTAREFCNTNVHRHDIDFYRPWEEATPPAPPSVSGENARRMYSPGSRKPSPSYTIPRYRGLLALVSVKYIIPRRRHISHW